MALLALIQTVVTFIIVLGILIFFHELGHYIAAKRFGIYVDEFALGFGPKLLSRQGKETTYSIRAFPLGGFCKMIGEMPHDESIEDPLIKECTAAKRCFYQKPAYQRFIVVAMGPVMNIFLAFVIFVLVFSLLGIPVDVSETSSIGDVVPGHPAEQAGLRAGDRVIGIEGQSIDSWNDMVSIIEVSGGQELEFEVMRGSRQLSFLVSVAEGDTGRGTIGIYSSYVSETIPLGEAVRVGALHTMDLTRLLIRGFYDIITRQAPAEVGGPVRIAQMVGDAARVGLDYLANFTAFISINLAIINLLPIPALDGGRILFILFEIIRGKPVDPEKEGFVHFIGFVFLMALIVLIVIRDITQIF